MRSYTTANTATCLCNKAFKIKFNEKLVNGGSGYGKGIMPLTLGKCSCG